MKVFVLTEGSYSDYGIHAIFSSQENADRYIATARATGAGGDFNKIQEWELDELLANSDRIERGERLYQIVMHRDGSSGIQDVTYSAHLTEESATVHPAGLWVYRWATSEEHAAKIANEIRTQKIALGEWEG